MISFVFTLITAALSITSESPIRYTTHYKKQCPSNNWVKTGRYTFGEALQICTDDPKCVAFNFGAKPDPADETTHGIEATTYFHHNCRSTAYESWHDNLYVKDPKPSSDCQVQDNDACISQVWNGYTCASVAQYCDSHAKDMYRCCPETCEASELNEADCNALSQYANNPRGNCDYAHNPQICIHPPTFSPSDAPSTSKPTFAPSDVPTTSIPTFAPTTSIPTFSPSDAPTTAIPTFAPTTAIPTFAPTPSNPTFAPTPSNPTFAPSKSPIITPQVTYTTHYKKQCPSNNWVLSGRYTFGEALQICTEDPKCVAFNFGAKPDPNDESTHGIEASTYFHHNCRSTAYESWHDNLYVKDPIPSTGCQVQDNDACIQKVWDGYTCESAAQWCDSHAKDMYRCCPETCEAGELSEDECNALSGHGNCDYADNPQICIAELPYSCVGLSDGEHDISLGGDTPIRVTCVDGWVELQLQRTPHSDNAWIVSHSRGNSFAKCQCMDSISGLTDGRGVPAGRSRLKCKKYHKFTYKSGGHILTDEELLRLSESHGHTSYDRDFDVISTSCDDDRHSFPRGHWIAFEHSIGGGRHSSTRGWTPYDCRSGNNNCCERNSMDSVRKWDTYPMPRKVCGSTNTGGGVAMAIVERGSNAPKTTLKIRPSNQGRRILNLGRLLPRED